MAATIVVEGLERAFDEVLAVRGVDLEVDEGEIYGFLGPAPRWVLLVGLVLSASLRAFIPATFVLAVAFGIGAHWPGLDGLLLAYGMVALTAAVAACYASGLALHYKSQSAAPLMQAGMLALILATTAYAPLELLQGWLQDVATVNPMTLVVDAARQGFVGSLSWAETWPGLVALAAMLALMGALSLREMRRTAI